MRYKKEWSSGNGQCPDCLGNKPHSGWWTATVGHKKKCSLAKLMRKAGLEPIMEHENYERSIGWYPNETGVMVTVKANSSQEEKDKATEYANRPDGINAQLKKIINDFMLGVLTDDYHTKEL